MATTNEELRSCEQSDRVLMMLLGMALEHAALRLGLIPLVTCAAAAGLVKLVQKT